MVKEEEIVLNTYLQPSNSPAIPIPFPPKQVSWKKGTYERTQTRSIRVSKINMKSFVMVSPVVSGTVSCVSGGTINLSSYLTPQVPHSLDPNFAIIYAAIYLGTSNAIGSQLYPALGTGVVGTQYTIHAGLDQDGRNTVGGTAFNGTNSVWSAQLINNSGATGTFALYTQWKYLQWNSGTNS